MIAIKCSLCEKIGDHYSSACVTYLSCGDTGHSMGDKKCLLNNVECFHCDQKGHYRQRCPLSNAKDVRGLVISKWIVQHAHFVARMREVVIGQIVRTGFVRDVEIRGILPPNAPWLWPHDNLTAIPSN